MKATFLEQVSEIREVINSYSLINDRVEALNELGYEVNYYPMGSGGTGQIREMKDHWRVQIGYARGRYNYALAVRINK